MIKAAVVEDEIGHTAGGQDVVCPGVHLRDVRYVDGLKMMPVAELLGKLRQGVGAATAAVEGVTERRQLDGHGAGPGPCWLR